MRAALKPVIGEVLWTLEGLPERQTDEIAQAESILSGAARNYGYCQAMSEELARASPPPSTPSCTILGLEAILNDLEALSLDGRRFAR